MATTLTQYRAAVSANVGLNNSSTPPGDQTNLDAWINGGVSDICVRTRCNTRVFTTTLTSGSYDYTIGTGIVAINEVFLTDASNSVRSRLRRVSPQEILDYRVGTQFAGAPPVAFYALDGYNLLMVYPTPTGADTITIYGTGRPATLTAGSDTPSEVPVEWQELVEFYASWRAGMFINDAASQNGATWLKLYEDGLKQMRRAMLHMGGRRLSKAVVGNWGGNRPIGRPDQQSV